MIKSFILAGIVVLFNVLIADDVSAQLKMPDDLTSEKSYSNSNVYLFPVNPGKANFLAGTMGELRNTHFHAGIDIRTNNMVGLPIRATQEGYISKVIVGAYGYGHALMLQHPDGNTSLYGHLEQFKGAIAEFVLNEQYKRKSYEIDINLEPNQFPVSKGDTIALSGNTGGSTGPHLHFEIRNDKNEALNPLSFGFMEIGDKYSPIPVRVALKPLDIHSRVNDKFGRHEFGLVGSGNAYKLPHPIFAHGNIGVEILAYDKLDLSPFKCGINHIDMYVDSVLVFSQKINKIDFATTRDIVTLMDYKSVKSKGVHYNKLYVEDGNPFQFYEPYSKGSISITSGTRVVKIVLRDLVGNESTASFKLQFDPHTSQVSLLEYYNKPITYEIQENVLMIHAKYFGKPGTLSAFQQNKKEVVNPAYFGNGHQVFLIDLKKTVPDSLRIGYEKLNFAFKDVIPSGTDYTYYGDGIEVFFPKGSLYDTLYMQLDRYKKNNRAVTLIGDPLVPIKHPIRVVMKVDKLDSTGKSAIYHIESNRYEYLSSTFTNGKVTFSAPKLGEFVLLTDLVAPVITKISITNRSARLRIRDNLSGIEKIEANIDGKWLLMRYDYKTGIVQSEQLDSKTMLKGMFELKVTDRAGNDRIFKYRIL